MARIYRKLLATIVEWTEGSGGSATTKRELLGLYTPDSSIEFNSRCMLASDRYLRHKNCHEICKIY